MGAEPGVEVWLGVVIVGGGPEWISSGSILLRIDVAFILNLEIVLSMALRSANASFEGVAARFHDLLRRRPLPSGLTISSASGLVGLGIRLTPDDDDVKGALLSPLAFSETIGWVEGAPISV